MRPTLRTTFLRTAPLALVATCALAISSSAAGLELRDGSYATDLSTSTPSGLQPASGTSLPYPSADVALTWDAVPGADQYQVQLARQAATSADCNATNAFQLDNIVLTTSTSQTEWVPTFSSEEEGSAIWTGTYCWRVRTTGKGYGAWSEGSRFVRTWASTIGGLKFFNDHDGPVPRRASDPDFATGNTVTRNAGYLTWDELPGAAQYEVEVSASRAFAASATVVRRKGITDNRITLLHLPDDTYFWRVRGIAPNGTEGAWSTQEAVFTVRWLEAAWSAPSRLSPADASVQSEMRIGWTPMPGATHYEYQAGTDAGCFWNPDVPSLAPAPWGEWVKTEVSRTTTDPPVLISTGDPHPSSCRLTDIRATTLNNWVTVNDLIGSEATENMNVDCWPIGEPTPICEPAPFPTSNSVDFGSAYHGTGEVTNGVGDYSRTGDGQYSEPVSIWWRARPVYHVTQDNETGWEIEKEGGLRAYGSWTRYTEGGANRQHHFDLNPTTAPLSSVGTRCEGRFNPGSACLEHVGSTMQADEAAGVTNDRSMQFPAITWKPFSGADGYVVEIARDPLFNNIALTDVVTLATQQSYSMTESMPDNSEGTGYWWRVVPCKWDSVTDRCMPIYSGFSGGLPASYGIEPSYSDMAVHQTFPKQSAVKVELVPNFEGATPLLRWARSDVGASDWAGWSRGLEGAEHYEVQLARDPFFTQDARTLKTSVPRIVPYSDGEEEGTTTALPDGLWYYRIRGIDRNDVSGAWTATASFNKRVEAPVPAGPNGASGPGVVIDWAPVDGAGSYEVQWTSDGGFEQKPSSATTLQSSFRIPDGPLGRQYWRVRAVVNGVAGSWSGEVRYVDIVAPTTIRYGLNRERTLAGGKVQITGELKVAGAAVNGERIRLQRKTGGCDNARGRYVDSSTGVTGDRADDGHVNIPARVLQNTCFRMAWTGGPKVRYSAPIAVNVVPNMRVFVNRKLVRRGKPVCTAIRSNVAIRGRVRVQYRVGRSWRTSRAMMMRGQKRARLCASITKAGRYSTRVVFDNMKHRQGWKQYDDVIRGTGIVRVNDVWRIVRSR